MFTPFGNMMRLPDGRVLRKTGNGVWIDQNTGSQYNPQTMRDLMYSANFDIPDGGRGKKTPMWVIGVAGSATITNWLNDVRSGTDSLDVVFVGDSNVGYNNTEDKFAAQGLADNFILAGICAGMRMYGSPIQFMAGNAVEPIQNYLGYNCYAAGIRTNTTNGYTSGNQFGPIEYQNQFGISLGNWSPAGQTLPIFSGYAWASSGKSVSSEPNWYIGNTGGKTGLDTGLSLTCRMIIGSTGATGGGMIRFLGYETIRYIGDDPSDYIPITFTGGFTAYEKDCTRTMGNTALSFYIAGNPTANFTATGPFGMAMSSFYNPVKGIATSALAHMPGATLGAVYRACTLAGVSAGNDTIVNALREVYNRQVKAGGSGRVCVFVEGGVNLDTNISDTPTYMQNIVNFFKSEWLRAGLPSNKITFVGMNTWTIEPGSVWAINLPTVVNSMVQYARYNSDFTYLDVIKFGGGDYAGWTAAGYYNSSGPEHLSSLGYSSLCKDLMTALLKSGRNTYRG